MNDSRKFTVAGTYPTYTVTDERGRPYTVRWMSPAGAKLRLPTCDCGAEAGSPLPCDHANAAHWGARPKIGLKVTV